jgi:hypothetical protein
MKFKPEFEISEVVLCYGTFHGEPIGYGFITEKGLGYDVHSFKLNKIIKMNAANIAKVITDDKQERFTDY